MRTTQKQLEQMTTNLKALLEVCGDPEAPFIQLCRGSYGYYLAVFPDGPHRGYSTSRFGDIQSAPGVMWSVLRGMCRALEGVPAVRAMTA